MAAALIPYYWIMSGHQATDTAATIANARIDLIRDAVKVSPNIAAGLKALEVSVFTETCTHQHRTRTDALFPANSGLGYS